MKSLAALSGLRAFDAKLGYCRTRLTLCEKASGSCRVAARSMTRRLAIGSSVAFFAVGNRVLTTLGR